MAKGKLFGFLAGLFLGATALMGTPKTANADVFRGFIHPSREGVSMSLGDTVKAYARSHVNGVYSDTLPLLITTSTGKYSGNTLDFLRNAPTIDDTLIIIAKPNGRGYKSQIKNILYSGTNDLFETSLDSSSVGTFNPNILELKDTVVTSSSDTIKAIYWKYGTTARCTTNVDTLSNGATAHPHYWDEWANLSRLNLNINNGDTIIARYEKKATGGSKDTTWSTQIMFKADRTLWDAMKVYNGNVLNADSLKFHGDTLVFPDSMVVSTPNGVELSYFGAMPSKNGIKIEWETQSSLNSYLWEILRGEKNDSLDYDLIATQPGDGNSNQPKHWYYDDACAKGTNWYKLAEVDFSGLRTFYGPFSATAGLAGALKEGKFKEWPNPVKDLRHIKVDKAGKYGVYNIAGQKAGTLEYNINGTTVPQFSSPTASGIYLLRHEETGETEKVTVVK